jgi:hypothetical protein
MRVYAAKVELQDGGGGHLRYIPGALAQGMVSSGHAAIACQNGRVKAVKLLQCAATLHRIGPPTGTWGQLRFTRIVRTDAGVSWIEFHPRSTY